MTRWMTLTLALAAPALLAGPARAQTTLRYRLKAGDALTYVMTQDAKAAMSVAGNDINIRTTQQMHMAWDVRAVDDAGNARVHLRVNRFKMDLKGGPMGDVAVDSKHPREPADEAGKVFAQVAAALGDLAMTFTLSPTGEMSDVKIDQRAQQRLKDLPGVEKLGGDLFSPEGLKRMAQGGMLLPTDAVRKGHRWTQKSAVKLPFGKTTGDVEYTYEGPAEWEGRPAEKIRLKPALKIEPDPQAAVQITVKSQEGSGTAYFDNRAGRLAALTNETTMEMAVQANGMDFTQRVVQTTTLRLQPTAAGERKERDD